MKGKRVKFYGYEIKAGISLVGILRREDENKEGVGWGEDSFLSGCFLF